MAKYDINGARVSQDLSWVAPPFTSINLGSLDELRMRVELSPGASLLSLVADAIGGYPQGADPRWAGELTPAINESDRLLGRAFFTPPLATIPDCLSPSPLIGETTAEAYLARIADASPDQIVDEVYRDFGSGALPATVEELLTDPRSLRDSFRRLMVAAWKVYAPVWRQSSAALAREQERMGISMVTGTLDAALISLGERARLIGRQLNVSDPRAERVLLGSRTLVLVPLTSGRRASLLNLDDPRRIWIGYSAPSLYRSPSRSQALELIFGVQRAEVLRESASNPTMADLAGTLGVARGAVTYHCDRLESAGLIERLRIRGRVRVRRTERGDEVVELLASER